ncbi:uncharacterized protein DNG_05183 [Cephalotrichum gorgonifer]|uniref:Uncharacterized protein n=1 Tax=Cephalotrichum gorgonifer TaxID=2041049 RepID=A0AAE8MXZ5_9PEZI|nr:uncharacterized protein DNG_05183 [Cephalotrichum gorgonifer]
MFAPSPRPPAVLDTSVAVFFDWLPKDCRIGNPERLFWEQWQYVISLYGFHCTAEEYQHEKCWGWTVLRTSYDDDEEFSLAVAAIQRLALVRLEDEYREGRLRGKPDNDMNAVEKKLERMPGYATLRERLQKDWNAMVGPARDTLPEGEPLTPDWVITHELARRYHNIVVQDRQALDGADVAKAWEYAHTLGLQGQDGPCGEYIPGRENGPRSHFFIYLDKESIHRLAQAPSREELASMASGDRSKTAWDFWVKVVSNNCKVGEGTSATGTWMR